MSHLSLGSWCNTSDEPVFIGCRLCLCPGPTSAAALITGEELDSHREYKPVSGSCPYARNNHIFLKPCPNSSNESPARKVRNTTILGHISFRRPMIRRLFAKDSDSLTIGTTLYSVTACSASVSKSHTINTRKKNPDPTSLLALLLDQYFFHLVCLCV